MTLWQSNDKLNDNTIFGALLSIRKKFMEYSKKIKDEVEKINQSATDIKKINQQLNGGPKQGKEEYLGDILKNKLK
jgi:flagellar hook-associated protein FlgK